MEETLTTDINEMSDSEFNTLMDGEVETDVSTEESTDTKTDTDTEEEDLDSLYAKQLGNKEAKLSEPILIKINGRTHKVDSVDELRNLAERGLNHTQKMQQLARERKELQEMYGSNRDVEDTSVTPESYEVDRIAEDILSSNYADAFRESIAYLPETVKSELATSATLLSGLFEDVRDGIATPNVMREVDRLMAINGLPFNIAYVTAINGSNKAKGADSSARQMIKSQPKPNTAKVVTKSVNEMSDSEFDKYFASL